MARGDEKLKNNLAIFCYRKIKNFSLHRTTACMRLRLFTKASAQIAIATSHTRERYTQFKKYFSFYKEF